MNTEKSQGMRNYKENGTVQKNKNKKFHFNLIHSENTVVQKGFLYPTVAGLGDCPEAGGAPFPGGDPPVGELMLYQKRRSISPQLLLSVPVWGCQ
jgi:hypothetical protein